MQQRLSQLKKLLLSNKADLEQSQQDTKKPPLSRKAVFVYSFITFPFLS